MADIPGLDEFAQTRGADDLFDDEIIPVAAEEPQQPLQPTPPEPQVVEEPVTTADGRESTPARTETPTRPRGGERRGRGRGRGRSGRGAQNSGQKRSDGPKSKTDDGAAEPEAQDGEDKSSETPGEKTEQTSSEDATAPAEAPRVPAVRGDRSATGGVKKPKLTEEELSQRIAAARENAAKKAAAHARAEADQASFMEREKIAERKRREERQNRRVMDTERERNRLRKLEALTGREWDADKPEDQFSSRGGRGQFRRGMHGGVSGYTRRGFEDSQAREETPDSNAPQPHSSRGRGRGGRGGRGRGNHRGSRDQPSDTTSQDKATPAPVINNEVDFPSLPGGDKKDTAAGESNPTPQDDSKPLSPVSGATWADQVEAHRE
ncbi:uncharacterized protein BJX67DRAFT_345244 [Aspergillus lucknowensis]|uniref:Uncharacterized protein n=1 Tax=Aspergillus lucknowensis TaxID=176173 RepID=A0ABR4M0K1_9EURO